MIRSCRLSCGRPGPGSPGSPEGLRGAPEPDRGQGLPGAPGPDRGWADPGPPPGPQDQTGVEPTRSTTRGRVVHIGLSVWVWVCV